MPYPSINLQFELRLSLIQHTVVKNPATDYEGPGLGFHEVTTPPTHFPAKQTVFKLPCAVLVSKSILESRKELNEYN